MRAGQVIKTTEQSRYIVTSLYSEQAGPEALLGAEKQDLPIAEFVDRRAGALTHGLFAKRNARAQQPGESRCDRSERERCHALSVGSTEV